MAIVIEGNIIIGGGITWGNVDIAPVAPLNLVTDSGDQLITLAGDSLVTLQTS